MNIRRTPLQRYATLILLCFLPSSLIQAADSKGYFGSQSEFDTFKKLESKQFNKTKDEFRLYKQQLLSAFDQYKYQTSRIWGDKNTVSPDSKNWINYQNDLQHRSVVDFEKGTIDVEIAIDSDQNISDDEAQKQLRQTIINSLQQGSDKRSVLDMAKKPVSQPSGTAVLAGLVAKQDGSDATSADYAQLAAQSSSTLQKKNIKGNDGKSRIIYKAQLHLVPNHIRKRAMRYKSQIEINAQQQKIPSAMILAIMETESMFNPTARSPVPAFGLMQLVPGSGARDAYRHLYNKDRIVSDIYLYKPENNIKLGAAFLNRLYYNYLSGIKDPVSRQWATIAAYNTGAGNVFRTFAGKYRKSRFGNRKKWKQAAYSEINKMNSDEVYAFLRKRLPYVETRSYMKKVSSRMNKYKSI
jgi:peptidoglycan lytic transglycosylase C